MSWTPSKAQWGDQPYTPLPDPAPGPYPGPAPAYAQSYQMQQRDNDYPSDVKNPYEGGRFAPKKRIHDPIFLILFIAQLVGFSILAVVVLIDWIKKGGLTRDIDNDDDKNHVKLNKGTAVLLLCVTGAALILSTLYLILTRALTKIIMHITLILSICLNIGICVYYWITKSYIAAVVFTIIAIISIFAYFGYRSRIPLASLLLQTVMDIAKHHPSVYVVAFISLVLQAAFSVFFIFAAVATYEKYNPDQNTCKKNTFCATGKSIGFLVFELFSYIWTSQVIGNVALATMAGGPFGSWYYFGPRELGQMPSHPTLTAFVRASTLSLGSIAFGSLIVTILELIRIILQIAKDNANSDGHPVEACLALCAECFIDCIEGMVQYFNRYAYIEIALYGKPYIQAAKDTWGMFKDRGIDALINDSLVSMALTWGGYAVGLLCGLFAYLYLHYGHPSYNADGQYTIPVAIFAFLVGLQCSLMLSSAIEAGVSTIFVGLGEDPQVLATRAPELYGMIAQAYPQVISGIPRV